MRLRVIAVGTRMPDWVGAAFEEYARRLRGPLGVELKEVAAARRSASTPAERAIDAEAQRVLEALAPRDHVVALDERGTEFSSRELARWLEQRRRSGQDLACVIGGPDGLAPKVLARAQQACCDSISAALPGMVEGHTPEHLFMEMFHAEWRAARPEQILQTIAIVDETPVQQYLYPEFLLFRQLFERHGLTALICAPHELVWSDGALWHEGRRIDLVYNRLTDFSLSEPGNAVLRAAWLADGAVITPHPQGHALYADKRNLITLCDDALLESWGVPLETRALLVAGIPQTRLVDVAHADDLWARRRQLFFKPASGYGSKAAYRGDKLTRRVFDEILSGGAGYVVQALAPPSSRQLSIAGASTMLKLDLRNYVYDGQVQLVAARLWQGQTTNFRTPGGGFAPVLTVPCRDGVVVNHT